MNASPALSNGLGAPTSIRTTRRPRAAGARRRDFDGFFSAVLVGDDDPGRGLVVMADDRHQNGALIVADSGHGHVQQRVEQLALALFELAGDHHPDQRVGDPLTCGREPGRQVGPVVEVGDGAGVVDQFDDHADLAPVLRLVHLTSLSLSKGMPPVSRTRIPRTYERGGDPGEGGSGCPAAPSARD